MYVYEGAAANAAIRMAGMEMSMFVDRKDVTIANEYSKLSDEELAQKLVEVGQLMLAGPVIEQDEIDLISGLPRPVPNLDLISMSHLQLIVEPSPGSLERYQCLLIPTWYIE